jgi:hypothetical protein
MKDFLTNIAARSLGLANVIRPRRIAIFEPFKVNGAARSIPLVQESSNPVTEPKQNISAPGALPSQMYIQPPTSNVPWKISSSPIEANVGDLRPAPTPSSELAETERTVHSSVSPSFQPSSPAENGSFSRSTQPASPIRPENEERVLLSAQLIQMKKDSSIEKKVSTRLKSRINGLPEVEVRLDGPEAGRFEKHQTVSRESVEVNHLLIPSKLAALPKLPPDTKPESGLKVEPAQPPAIQVTIGRIEVRASANQAPVSSPRSRESIMTLDEYLQRRARGEKQ